MLFETAHLSAFHIDHFVESRVGFYFKDTEEFGLYSIFVGNDDDVIQSYYRTDRTFQKEEMLLTNDEDRAWPTMPSAARREDRLMPPEECQAARKLLKWLKSKLAARGCGFAGSLSRAG